MPISRPANISSSTTDQVDNSNSILKAILISFTPCHEIRGTEWAVLFNHKAFCVTRAAAVTLCRQHTNSTRHSMDQVWLPIIQPRLLSTGTRSR